MRDRLAKQRWLCWQFFTSFPRSDTQWHAGQKVREGAILSHFRFEKGARKSVTGEERQDVIELQQSSFGEDVFEFDKRKMPIHLQGDQRRPGRVAKVLTLTHWSYIWIRKDDAIVKSLKVEEKVFYFQKLSTISKFKIKMSSYLFRQRCWWWWLF